MKLLKIEKSLGYFLGSDSEYSPIDKITKEELLRMVSTTLESNVELDEYNEDEIKNQAHQVIYKNVYKKIKELTEKKQEFVDTSERMFLEEYEKYGDKSTLEKS